MKKKGESPDWSLCRIRWICRCRSRARSLYESIPKGSYLIGRHIVLYANISRWGYRPSLFLSSTERKPLRAQLFQRRAIIFNSSRLRHPHASCDASPRGASTHARVTSSFVSILRLWFILVHPRACSSRAFLPRARAHASVLSSVPLSLVGVLHFI